MAIDTIDIEKQKVWWIANINNYLKKWTGKISKWIKIQFSKNDTWIKEYSN